MGQVVALADPRHQQQFAFPLLQKLSQLLRLTNEETAFVQSLHEPTRTFKRRREVLVQGRSYDYVFLICDGVAVRYKALPDGSRQGLGFVLSGDFIGFPASLFATAVNSVVALTDVTVSAIPLRRFVDMFRQFPRLGAALFWSTASEIARCDERLVDLGRRSAYERLAHLLSQLLMRLRAVGQADGGSFVLPLTQELMADLLGLSTPHLNRMVRMLREEGLVTIEDHHVTVHDFESLAALAGFDEGYLSVQPVHGLSSRVANLR